MIFLVLLPLLLVIMVVLWVTCGRAFFIQERIGYGCRRFNVIKFRTMNNRRDAEGNLLPDTDRCTRVGNFLRNWSLDELPQLINIIKGDMSFVGPRPFMPCYVENCSKTEHRRHNVRPGITGIAQIKGRNSISYKNRFRYDVWYVKHYSFAIDFAIAWRTVLVILGINKSKNITDYDPTIEHGLRT